MLGLALASAHATDSQESLKARVKVNKTRAEKIALTKAPGGTIKTGELEREHRHLVWSFDIAEPHSRNITEVQVDAVTGKIVSVATETPAQQATEARGER